MTTAIKMWLGSDVPAEGDVTFVATDYAATQQKLVVHRDTFESLGKPEFVTVTVEPTVRDDDPDQEA